MSEYCLTNTLYENQLEARIEGYKAHVKALESVIDFICGDFVHVRYLNDTGRDVIKKVPVDYFLVHWDLSWRVD